MACPAEVNLCRVRGDTQAITFVVQDGDGNPIDISADAFALAVDPSPSPEDATANLFVLTGTIVDGPNGKVAFAPSLVQADQEPGVYFYDVQWTLAGGTVRTIARGQWEIQQDVTK